MDVYGDHLLHCERGTHKIARHEEQVLLLAGDLSKAALHPVLEPYPSSDIEKGRASAPPAVIEVLTSSTLPSVILSLLRGSGTLYKTRTAS